MNITEINNIQGFDKSGNKVIELDNTQFYNIELVNELTNALNQFGITAAQFAQNTKLMATLGFSSMNICLPGSETKEKLENPNQKSNLEIFNQIEWNKDFLKLSADNEFLN